MRIGWMIAIAAMAPVFGGSAYASPNIAAAAAAPTAGQYEADLQELAAWMQMMNGRQDNMSVAVERMWDAFDEHNKLAETSTNAELQPSFGVLLGKIRKAKADLEAERALIEAIQPLTRNVVLIELPPGHLGKLKQHAIKSADGFLTLVDRAETQVTAMSLGETDLSKEFALLTMDSSIEMVQSQWNLAQSNKAIAKKNTAGAWKMESLSHIYEAMDHVLREQRALAAGEGLGIDLVKIKLVAAKMADASVKGLLAVRKARAEFNANRRFLTAGIADAQVAQHESYQRWFEYLAEQSSSMAAWPDTVQTDDPHDPEIMPVLDQIVALESKFLELHNAMLQRVVN